MLQTACLQKFKELCKLHSMVSACYKCGGSFPLVVFTWWESKLSYCYQAKSFMFHWIFIYLCGGFFVFFNHSAYPFFTFMCRSFGKLLCIKMTPCGLYCFPVKSDAKSESGFQFTNYRNTRDAFTGYVERKLAVLDQMPMGSLNAASLRRFSSFILPKKNESRENHSLWCVIFYISCHKRRSQRVQQNIVTQQTHHTPYRCSVSTEQCPNLQTVCSLQCLGPPRSLSLADELRLQRRPVSTVRMFICAKRDLECASALLWRYKCCRRKNKLRRNWEEKNK